MGAFFLSNYFEFRHFICSIKYCDGFSGCGGALLTRPTSIAQNATKRESSVKKKITSNAAFAESASSRLKWMVEKRISNGFSLWKDL